METAKDDAPRRWRAVLAYDEESNLIENGIREFKTRLQNRHADKDGPSTIKSAPYRAVVHMVCRFLSQYIGVVGKEAEVFTTAIREVEDALVKENRLSSLLHRLNSIGREISSSNLRKKMEFSIDATAWARSISRLGEFGTYRPENAVPEARELEQYHPDRLKEKIAEVHQRIDDVIAERQLEKQEMLVKEYERREEREKERQDREDKRQKQIADRWVFEDDRQKAEDKLREERAAQEVERRKLEEIRLKRAEAQQKAHQEKEWKVLEKNTRIAEATLQDSRTMSGVAWVTMAFLPATFVSSFFGMNFFNGIAGNVPFDEASRSVWLFFAIAIPTSAFVLLTFYFWDKQEEKKELRNLESTRSATMADQNGATALQPTEAEIGLSRRRSRVESNAWDPSQFPASTEAAQYNRVRSNSSNQTLRNHRHPKPPSRQHNTSEWNDTTGSPPLSRTSTESQTPSLFLPGLPLASHSGA